MGGKGENGERVKGIVSALFNKTQDETSKTYRSAFSTLSSASRSAATATLVVVLSLPSFSVTFALASFSLSSEDADGSAGVCVGVVACDAVRDPAAPFVCSRSPPLRRRMPLGVGESVSIAAAAPLVDAEETRGGDAGEVLELVEEDEDDKAASTRSALAALRSCAASSRRRSSASRRAEARREASWLWDWDCWGSWCWAAVDEDAVEDEGVVVVEVDGLVVVVVVVGAVADDGEVVVESFVPSVELLSFVVVVPEDAGGDGRLAVSSLPVVVVVVGALEFIVGASSTAIATASASVVTAAEVFVSSPALAICNELVSSSFGRSFVVGDGSKKGRGEETVRSSQTPSL